MKVNRKAPRLGSNWPRYQATIELENDGKEEGASPMRGCQNTMLWHGEV